MVRTRSGSRNFSHGTPGPSSANGVHQDPVHVAINTNPWEDTRPQHSRSGSGHRLSYDVASGVIMLPDDADWLEDDADSDEENYGTEHNRGLDGPIADLIDGGSASAAGGETEEVDGGVTPTISISPSRTSRYGTYFHHPERRRQPIPGAFPMR